MPIDDESGEYIPPHRQYLDNLLVVHPELGQCELWQAIAWETSKLRNHMARADSAGAVDEGAGAGVKQPPPLVADGIARRSKADLMTRVMDSLKGLSDRMAALEQRADEQDRRAQADAALALAEDIAEHAPQALLSSLSDRADRRLH
jgi:hypothetical protein